MLRDICEWYYYCFQFQLIYVSQGLIHTSSNLEQSSRYKLTMIVSECKHIALIQLGCHLFVPLAVISGTVTDEHGGPVKITESLK